ncbi:glutathione transferase GstA [Pseudomaricurvus alkylphenolicus]|uniref:glutathione transferase GstA n=1 Tax=Pseudomaricurvus alkylphenolicus TaxID=1306991 RepID=UPI00141F9C22|nr:glutathione transferase GstA [Pseudomaricurvus alkylphenolicus]NIB40513.1 glutathione transferase GstA [Pseudomaricurvus alkylphenolicus]
MKLYYTPGGCSLVPHIIAREADLDIELIKVDVKTHRVEDGTDYFRITKLGLVPLLILDDESRLSEVQVVAQYLADQRPQSELAPLEGTFTRYQHQQWLSFISTEIHKSFRPLIRSSDTATISETKDRLMNRLGYISDMLKSDYLMGETFSAADAYLFVTLLWAKHLQLSIPSKLEVFFERIAARPAVQTALSVEGL